MKLKNIKKAPFEIASLLASNQKIINLIYNDTTSALSDDVSLTAKELIEKNYISFYPVSESGIKDISKNTFIIINLEDINLQARDNNVTANGSIYITTDQSHCLLDNNKIRLLELADEIESTIENEKISSAGKITIWSIDYIAFSDFRSGYRISFRFSDQPTRKAEL